MQVQNSDQIDSLHTGKTMGTSLCFKARLSANPIDMKMSFYSQANDTHFHKKGFSLGLVFKVRIFGPLPVKYVNELIRSVLFLPFCSCCKKWKCNQE